MEDVIDDLSLSMIIQYDLTVHTVSTQAKLAMDDEPYTRVEDFDDWFTLEGKPSKYWFTEHSGSFYGFNSESMYHRVIKAVGRKSKPYHVE